MVDKINELVSCLCEKDRKIAERLIEERNYAELKLLVDSSIVIYEKNLNKEHPKEELLNLNRENLLKLKSKVDEYVYLIDPEFEEYDEDYF